MHSHRKTLRRVSLASIGLTSFGLALSPGAIGQALPAMHSTVSPLPPASPPPLTVPTPEHSPVEQSPHHAEVTLSNGKLAVSANNSSLNQILRDIARITSIKLTGGVADQRVFGQYGPADTSAVLETLLSGSGSNMLLVKDARQLPQELVLTPRMGGPTAPNPNASRKQDVDQDDDSDLPPQPSLRPSRTLSTPSPVPTPFGWPSAQGNPPEPPITEPDAPSPTTTQQSPNGVKTPQQIYDQLLRLQGQRAKPTPRQAAPTQPVPDSNPLE